MKTRTFYLYGDPEPIPMEISEDLFRSMFGVSFRAWDKMGEDTPILHEIRDTNTGEFIRKMTREEIAASSEQEVA